MANLEVLQRAENLVARSQAFRARKQQWKQAMIDRASGKKGQLEFVFHEQNSDSSSH
jgi:hypothetical protein